MFDETKAAKALIMLQLIAKGTKPAWVEAKELDTKARLLVETDPLPVWSAMNYLNRLLTE